MISDSAPHYSNGRVLVVDDEPQILAVTRAILTANGLEVVVTDSGQSALEMISASLDAGPWERFSVVLLDLIMPGGMPGFEVHEKMQALDPELCVIACSGFFEEDARSLCRSIGFMDVLQKPYALDQLVGVVRRGMVWKGAAHNLIAG